MTELSLHNQSIKTVFDLLGSEENHMTYSLGWALAQSRTFLDSFATLMDIPGGFSKDVRLHLQQHQSGKGVTDLEFIDSGRHHIIMEAKRGFTVPSPKQLEKYAKRLNENRDTAARRSLIVLAESDRQERWLALNVPPQLKGIPIKSISWQKFIAMAERAANKGAHAERHLLRQLVLYLGDGTNMTNKNSNYVYVVSLSGGTFCKSPITFIEVVEHFKKYFHPVGGGSGGWPTEPPNYIGFRYYGKLQSIHFVRSYTVFEDFSDHFPVPRPSRAGCPLFLYTLGAAIKPAKDVPTNDPNGKYNKLVRATRRWCFIDLLLSCGSVAEAAFKSRKREQEYSTK